MSVYNKLNRMVVQGQLVEPTVCLSDVKKACETLIHSFIRQKPNNIMLGQQTFFFNIYEPKISVYVIYVRYM